jgi:TetR/AcrR family transcriptional regulator, transcriptional repressor for nem operon
MPASPASRRAQKADTRERIVRAAASAIRERGFAGTGVAEVMGEAGLTHGGFYAHFASREALLAEAASQAGADGVAQLARIAAAAPAGAGLEALVDAYLSDRHVERPARGCPIVAAGTELARQAPGVRHAATERIREMVDLIERQGGAWGHAAGHEQALAQLASLVGAMVIARAVDDPALSKTIRRAVRRQCVGAR